MPLLKQFAFTPLFIVTSLALTFFFKPALVDYLNIFFKPNFGIIEFGSIALFISLTALSFATIVTLSQKFIVSFISALLASATPFLFLDTNLAVVTALGLLVSFTLGYFNLNIALTSYIDFKPASLLSSPSRLVSFFLLLTLTFTYYLNANSTIRKDGFEVPKPLVEWAVDLTLQMQGMTVKGDKRYLAQSLTPEQMELLRQNPQVLEQFGVNPDDLMEFVSPSQTSISANQNSVQLIPSIPGVNLKDVLMTQTSNMLDLALKPYLTFIPFILAFMFFSLVSLLNWLISFLVGPLVSLIFYILEKSGFIKYEKTMREVKKIVI